MSSNFLLLNESKTDLIIITSCGPSTGSVNNLSSSLGALSISFQKEACHLGVIFESELTFDTQVTKVMRFCFAQLSNIQDPSPADTEKVNHAFISPRFNHCNALYFGISEPVTLRLYCLY